GDAESGCLFLSHGQDSDSHIGLIVAMGLLQVPKIHAIKLVTAQDQHLASAILLNVADVLANGIGGALIPVGGLVGLLGRQDLDETPVEIVKLIGIGDVP